MIYPLLGTWLDTENSVHSPLTIDAIQQAGFDASEPTCDEAYLDKLLETYTYTYGGFLEKRNIYERSEHFKVDGEYRNMHLGLDVWTSAGTPLYAPFDLKLHSFKNNDNYGDYGPTAIFHGNEEYPFLLVGHLALDDIGLWSSKTEYKEGEVIGHLGKPSENGGWSPHVHLQVMRDMQGLLGDYPGVCSPSQLEEYKKNLIDPVGLVSK